MRHDLPGGGFERSCKPAAILACTPASRPILSILESDEEMNAPADIYPLIRPDPVLVGLSIFPEPVVSIILGFNNDPKTGAEEGFGTINCTSLNFKELYAARNHRLRMVSFDA